MIARVADHTPAGLALLLHQYREKPRIAGLIASVVDRVQGLEDATWDVIVARLIDDAEGAQLDTLGRLVGQARRSAIDDVYRAWIRARIAANRSHGHPGDVIRVVLLATGLASGQLTYTEGYPASFSVDILEGLPSEVAQAVKELVDVAKPPGVGWMLIYSEHPVGDTFAFAAGDDATVDPLRGFTDDDDPATAPGGLWVETL